MRIEVNHQYVKNLANAASTYCTAQRREMSSADTDIKSMLASDWTGADVQAFGAQWEKADDSDSTTTKFYNAMKAYGEALRNHTGRQGFVSYQPQPEQWYLAERHTSDIQDSADQRQYHQNGQSRDADPN